MIIPAEDSREPAHMSDMTVAEVGFEGAARATLALVPELDASPDGAALPATTDLDIDPEVADQLRRCAASAGLSVNILLRALLAVQAPNPCVGDLVRSTRNATSVFRIERASADGRFFLSGAHGLHRAGSVVSAGWLPADEIRRVECTDR